MMQDMINKKLDNLERLLLSQTNINYPKDFYKEMQSLSKYFHLMNEEDRDYLNCARYAFEEQIEWKI